MPKPKDHAGKDFGSRRATSRAVIGGVPRDFKPFRDRAVKTLVLPCPVCKAGVDQKCVGLNSQTIRTSHEARRRMAIRAEREATA